MRKQSIVIIIKKFQTGMKIRVTKKRSRGVNTAVLLMAAVMALSGCGSRKQELVFPENEQYVKSNHSLVTVKRGDVESSFSLTLKGTEYERIDYSVDINMINSGIDSDRLVFDGCYVSPGQQVKKGDLLISYTDKALDREIKGYDDEINGNNDLIDHYTEMMEIDPSIDHSEEIKDLRDRNEVLSLYRKEAEAKRDNFKIYAKADGSITFVYDKITDYQGYIREYSRNGKYIILAEITGESVFSTTTEESYTFKEGEVHEAISVLNEYRMRVAGIEKVDGKTEVTFVPEDENVRIPPDTTLYMDIERPVMKDIVYVSSKAVRYFMNGDTYVYTVDEDGFRHAVAVELGDRIEGDVVILSGLQGGEEVSLD